MDYTNIGFINIFYIAINMVFCSMLMVVLTPLKYSTKKTLSVLLIVLPLHFMVNFKMIDALGFYEACNFFLISSTLTLFFTHYCLSSIRGFRFIFIFLTVCIFNNFGSFLSNLIAFKFEHKLIVYTLIQFLLFFSIIFIILKLFRKSIFRILNNINQNWSTFCILPLLFNMAFQKFNIFSCNNIKSSSYINLNIILFILFFAIYYIIYLYFIAVSSTFHLIKDNHMLELQKDFQRREYMDISNRVTSLRMCRHDMRHHFHILYALICNDNIDKATAYIDDVLEKLGE
ncbi:MAG: hypothetical protein WBH44_10525 [Proteocatella sp.]